MKASPKGHEEVTRPDSGLFADAADYDGDGDLDLIVGGYSHWTPKGRKLTDEEKARLAQLEAEMAEANQASNALYEAALKEVADASEEKQQAAFDKVRTSDAAKEYSKVMRRCREQIGELRPGPQRRAFVWLYRRAGATAAF